MKGIIMQDSRLRKAQIIEAELLQTFAAICEKEGLQYYLLGGTLIGAMRHHGFIPWDDDIDVGMPREDYNRFIEIAPKYLQDGKKVLHYKIDASTPFYFIKLLDSNVCFVIQDVHSTRELNCWIDIFPIDGVPDNMLVRWWHQRVLDYYKMLLGFSRIQNMPITENCPVWKKVIFALAYFFSADKYVDSVKAKQAMDRELEKYPISACTLAGNHVGVYHEKEFVPREYFGQGCEVEFEGRKHIAPAEPDKYLKNIYGDYMHLPPEEKRVSDHHVIEIHFLNEKAGEKLS